MRIATFAFAVFAFFSCLTVPTAWAQAPKAEKIEFRPSAEGPIQTLAVLGVQPIRRFKVFNHNPAGTAFGILPAMVYGLTIDKNGAEYVAEMNKRKISLSRALAQELHRQLSRKYKVVWYAGPVPLKADKTPDYEKIPIEADAILYVFHGEVGYYSPATDTSYFPLVQLGARMVDRKTWQSIYYSQLAAHPPGWSARALHYDTGPEPGYSFPNFEALMAGFDRSIEGLVLTQNRLAAQIARDLGVPEKSDAPELAPAAPEPPVAPKQEE